MNIYDKIRRMSGSETYEQKMYMLLNTDHYRSGQYRVEDMGEDMSMIEQSIWGWWKQRFLLDHLSQCAYEFMSAEYELLTIADEDIDWNSLKDQPDNAIARTAAHSAMYPTLLRCFHDGVAEVEWQINPDGKYWMDDDGFGMTNDREIALFGAIDRTGRVVRKFTYHPSSNFLLL